MNTDRACEFVEKSEKHLKWIQETISRFEEFGEKSEFENVEKEFFFLLGLFETIYQAIVDAAKQLELHKIREEINNDRENDELLKYIRFARNSEVHDAVLKWRPSMAHLDVKILDSDKLQSILGPFACPEVIFQYIYGVNSKKRLVRAISNNNMPDKQRCKKAGLEILIRLDCLALDSFEIGQGKKKRKINAPSSYLGQTIPPSAWVGIQKAHEYYGNKVLLVREKLNEYLTI
jgi:hypothetical protein